MPSLRDFRLDIMAFKNSKIEYQIVVVFAIIACAKIIILENRKKISIDQ
jgi:hypothetical protein